MRRHWRKLGRIYVLPDSGLHPKLLSHAANPVPIHLDADVYRIFFSSRDAANRSSVGAVDIDLKRRAVVHAHALPFFEHGPAGSFFEDGVSIGNCYRAGDAHYMLFMGWQTRNLAHWRGDIGRLRVNSDLTLQLDQPGPFLGTDETDRVSLSYPWVLHERSSMYRMWYGSTKTWDAGNGEMVHIINAAHSPDGHVWIRSGLAIPYRIGVAQAFSRPTVVHDPGNGYAMWFSYRNGCGETYRIGYAHSPDGSAWELDLDNAGIDVSLDGWDSEMIEYPCVFDHAGQRYMLYNGNGYGRSGFGLAVLSE